MFAKEDCIYLGKIIRTHGIHGQLVLATDIALEAQQKEEPILVELDGGLVPFYLDAEIGLKKRDHQSFLIKFDHISDKEQAENYTNCETYILSFPKGENEESLPTETSYLRNYSIYDANNNLIGKVNDVLDFSGNVLLQILKDDNEIMLPFTEEHIIDWDNEQRTIQLHIPEGLLDF